LKLEPGQDGLKKSLQIDQMIAFAAAHGRSIALWKAGKKMKGRGTPFTRMPG
jgi:hypothetical protein